MHQLRILFLLIVGLTVAACGRVADTTATATDDGSRQAVGDIPGAVEAPSEIPASAPSNEVRRPETTRGRPDPGPVAADRDDTLPSSTTAVGASSSLGSSPSDDAPERPSEADVALDDVAAVDAGPSPATEPSPTGDDERSIVDVETVTAAAVPSTSTTEAIDEQQVSTEPKELAVPSTTAVVTTSTAAPTTSAAPTTTTTTTPPPPTTPAPSSTTTPAPTTTAAPTTSTPTPTTASPAPAAAEPTIQQSAAPALTTAPAQVAMVSVDQIKVYPTSTSKSAEWSFDRTTQFGNPTVFLISGSDGSRLKVLLPVRQKHTYGWIDAADVTTSSTELRAVISLTNRDVSLYSGNQKLSASTAVIGKASTPTPVGSFFVTDKLRHANPAGGYGPWIVALSARSEALTSFNGGEPLIAIHGTNKPWLVGGRHSNGCIRLPNDAITALAQLVPLGTPVDIVA